ncbi:MAG TPA: hypothetical protein VMU47_06810 [Caldimonas sp.]|nr:hypothetical protein [Caldimonas sp.]
MATVIPFLSAGAGLYAGLRQSSADKFNAGVMQNEQRTAINQGAAQENLVRRASRQALGKESAAFAGAGVGGGVSSGLALNQSAVNQELDALNTRYKAQFTGYGYGVESQILRRQADEALAGGGLLAGAKALQALSGSYTTYPPSGMT